MKRLITLSLVMFLLSNTNLSALNVTANSSSLSCGMNTVVFTFDCAFTGSVLITGTTSGVGFPGLSGPPFIETVTNGVITIDVEIAGSAPNNFNISFIVLSSSLPCASNNDSATEGFVSTCMLPANDNCATATPITISSTACTPTSFSTTNGSTALSNPSCGGSGYHDLWYSFVANNATVTFDYGNVPGTVGYYGLYTSCGGTQVACSIIIPATGVFSFDFTGLTVGDDYFLQVMYLPGNSGADQTICLHSATVPLCPNNIIVSDAGPNLPNQNYDASQQIVTSGTCNVTGSNLLFIAGESVELNAGFDSGSGDFEVQIGACTP